MSLGMMGVPAETGNMFGLRRMRVQLQKCNLQDPDNTRDGDGLLIRALCAKPSITA